MKSRHHLEQRGSILLVFLAVLPFLILIALYYTNLSLTSFQVARFDQLHTEAQLAADAGADFAVEQFSQDNTWTSTSGEVTLHDDGKLKTTYTATLSGDNSAKVVAVTGKTYWPASSSTARRSVKIYVDLRPVTSGNYNIVAGEGGLFMSNSSKVVGGSVVVNGEINMSNTSQIGLSTNPVTVQVANQRCPNPPDATYPRVCNSGENGQPITINNQAHIYGTVTATGQTSGSGMSNPGLVSGSVAPQALPTYDRAGQKAAVANNMTASAASCSGKQAVTWPANTKITGDVSLSNQCVVTVQGNVWITGKLLVSNSSLLKIDDSVGSNRPNIMVDSQEGISFSNSANVISNASGTGAEFYTFYSKASCSPDCTSVTGTDLANSRSVSTINLSNSFTAPNTILYAYWSQVNVSNSGSIGALIGQTIQLNNSSAVTFGGTSGVGTTVWVVKGYRHQ
jgi:Tfp pilus assembly protein PilX